MGSLYPDYIQCQGRTCYFPGSGTGLTSSASAAARTLIRTTDAPKIKMSRPMALGEQNNFFFLVEILLTIKHRPIPTYF